MSYFKSMLEGVGRDRHGFYQSLKGILIILFICYIVSLAIYSVAVIYEIYPPICALLAIFVCVFLIEVEGKKDGMYSRTREKIVRVIIFLSIWSLIALGVYIFAQYYSWNAVFQLCAVVFMMYFFANYIVSKVAAKVYDDFQCKIDSLDRHVERLIEDIDDYRYRGCNCCCDN